METVEAPNEDLPSPGSIQFVVRDDYRITIYKDAQMAIVKYGYDARFYKIQSGDYEKAVELFYNEPKGNVIDLESLKAKYPGYFDLDTTKGLEVYVWQMAPENYSFGLLSGTNREKTDLEMWNMKGAPAEEMSVILSTYGIDKNAIVIVPWQNPISSYLGDYWITPVNENPVATEKRRQEYIDEIHEMLLGDSKRVYDYPIAINTYVTYANWAEDGWIFTECMYEFLCTGNQFRSSPSGLQIRNNGWSELVQGRC